MTTTTTTTIGTHVIMNVYDIHDKLLLTKLENGKSLSDQLINALQLNVVGTASHQFEPEGYTLLYLLSESHYSIHTYPEYHSCYIDIFCCNKDFQPKYAVEIVKRVFSTNNVSFHIISR